MTSSYAHEKNYTLYPLTTSSFPEDYTDEHVASAVLAIILLISIVYVLFSLIVYEYWVELKNRKVGRRKSLSVRVDKTADWMRWLCLAATVFSLLRFAFELVEIYEKNLPNQPCGWIRHVKVVLQSGAFTGVYLSLWLRQRQFYEMPAFHHLTGSVTRFFSWAMIFVMILANLLTLLIFVSTRSYESSPRGCILGMHLVWTKLPGLLQFLFTTIFQAILLGLLLYPLCKHRSISSTDSLSNQMTLIKRVTIATIFAILSTGLVSLLAITVLDNRYGALRQVVYDIDIFVTLLAVIISFRDWRARLFPYTTKKENVYGTLRRRILDQTTETTNVKCLEV